MATSALMEVIGDASAQLFERKFSFRRFRAVLADGLLTGFVLHHVYGLQARLLPASRIWWVPLCNIAVDELLVDPLFVAGFIFLTDCDWQRFWPTIQASKAVALTTLPLQWVNFSAVARVVRSKLIILVETQEF